MGNKRSNRSTSKASERDVSSGLNVAWTRGGGPTLSTPLTTRINEYLVFHHVLLNGDITGSSASFHASGAGRSLGAFCIGNKLEALEFTHAGLCEITSRNSTENWLRDMGQGELGTNRATSNLVMGTFGSNQRVVKILAFISLQVNYQGHMCPVE